MFTKADDKNCLEVRKVLETYSNASGQLVNYNKSAMCFSASISAREGDRMASVVGVNRVDCHEKYLELPCFSGRNKRKIFAEIVGRVWSRIKGWGEKLLSVGGKEILVKVVVQSVPTYAMGMFKLPKSLIQEIHRLSARFWWGGNEKNRKTHWCTWKKLCRSKLEGGLGFRDLETFNRALLAKQCWRILKSPESLAAKTLKGCYFPNCNFMEATKKSSGSFLWNSLLWGKGLLEKGYKMESGEWSFHSHLQR
ncbi:hypothetical protein Dsin_016498 [Dipteronia sinensis]|uniref:Uncharacterized protein n=1 Tax=Dipteronia sinensis TaxID=43782 RepID=A0AAE0E5S9_9ROSI|nr:hypothetical protein Dsin_016498 [Dipteronia sinensis]